MDHTVMPQLPCPKFHNERCWLFQIWSSLDKIHIVSMEFTVSFQRKQETDHQVLNVPIWSCGSMEVETSKSRFSSCLTLQC